MKNPNSQTRAGAFRVTETATLASPVSATRCPRPTKGNRNRFFLSPLTNAVEPLRILKGQIEHG